VLRLSRSRVISDIEFIINTPNPALGQRKWTSKGAECSVDCHSFAGEVYSFHVDIRQVRLSTTGSERAFTLRNGSNSCTASPTTFSSGSARTAPRRQRERTTETVALIVLVCRRHQATAEALACNKLYR
jgi:hypothetical protein